MKTNPCFFNVFFYNNNYIKGVADGFTRDCIVTTEFRFPVQSETARLV